MKKIISFLLPLAMVAAAAVALAGQAGKTPAQPVSQKELVQRFGFVDEDGDGINDLARDDDNDGIPNCMDPDWVRPGNGTGYKHKRGYMRRLSKPMNQGSENNFLYNFNYLWNHNWGGSNGTGVCDNSGPNGRQGRNRKTGTSR